MLDIRETFEAIETDDEISFSKISLINVLRSTISNLFGIKNSELENENDRYILTKSYFQADNFIKMFPTYIPEPEVYIDDDLEFCFDWIGGRYKYLSISVGGSSFCHFAAVIGENKFHGKEYYINEFPKTIKSIIIDNFS